MQTLQRVASTPGSGNKYKGLGVRTNVTCFKEYEGGQCGWNKAIKAEEEVQEQGRERPNQDHLVMHSEEFLSG